MTARLLRKLNALPAAAKQAIDDALLASAAELHQVVVNNVQRNSGSGRRYKRGQRTHVASAPGEYPNTDTGALVNSMRFERRGDLHWVWLAGIFYAKLLEFGTSRMAARPFARPSWKKVEPRSQKRVRSAVQTAIKKVASGG